MHAIVDNFLQRPKSHKIAFWAGSILIFCFIFWQYFYAARVTQASELEDKIDVLNAQIANENRLAKNLPVFRKEIKALQARLDSALKELPDKREIPGLLSSVATLARDSGLEVLRFAPRTDVVMDYYAAVPVDVDLKGTYQQVVTFFDEIARLSRVVNINDVTLKDPEGSEEDSQVQVQAGCVVTTFRYLDESERMVEEKAQAETKKRKSTKKKKTTEE